MSNQERKCENCEFFEQGDADTGNCLRYAPRPNSPFPCADIMKVEYNLQTEIRWPSVKKDSWCGEFQAKE